MRRVVITGIGIVSCIGNNQEEVLESLKAGKSGIKFNEEYAEKGFRSQISGKPDLELSEVIDKRLWRFMGDAAGYVHLSMEQAIEDAGLSEEQVSNPRTGIIVGSGGPSVRNQVLAADIVREKGAPKRIGPFAVPKAMSSTTSATAATNFKIKGVNFSITSACSTSAHCIGAATEQIQWGKQDVMFAGGGEELDWALSALFDAMGAMSSKYNDAPETAARAYDANRDGFVIGSGGGIVVLEELEHAKARGAKIYCELAGFGMSADAAHMTQPAENGAGAARAMTAALNDAALAPSAIDYINAHGTSTPLGDIAETQAIKTVFQDHAFKLCVSSTKSMIGHALGAAGAIEAVLAIKALETNIAPPTINLDHPDPECDLNYVPKIAQQRPINAVLSNSFGFGGTNGTVIFKAFDP
jgi:3-oxoacyl-[acyl-carrier-protein] synthase-1